MKWKSLSKTESEEITKFFDSSSPVFEFDSNFSDLRNQLTNAFEEILKEMNIEKVDIIKGRYEFDLRFAMKIYEILIHSKFNVRTASNDGIWRHISLKVIPDIVLLRWGNNPSRFWKESRRIWIKTLWWYIHLSWQGSSKKTFEVLKSNTTDEIVQLVERSGPSGYRIKLCREIMAYYGTLDEKYKKRSFQVFRKVMKLNTTQIRVVEPGLIIGGEKKYAEQLFKYFE